MDLLKKLIKLVNKFSVWLYNKTKGRQVVVNNTYEKLQNEILELIYMQKPYEAYINRTPRMKELEILILSSISYVDGISVLMKYEKYDSVFPICRTFIETYPSIIYMLDNFANERKFYEYFKKLIADDMFQDLSMYKSIKADTTIAEADKVSELRTYITRWKNNIEDYFSDDNITIAENNEEVFWKNTIKELHREYANKFGRLCKDKNDFIARAIKNNLALREKNVAYSDHMPFIDYCVQNHTTILALQISALHIMVFFLLIQVARKMPKR